MAWRVFAVRVADASWVPLPFPQAPVGHRQPGMSGKEMTWKELGARGMRLGSFGVGVKFVLLSNTGAQEIIARSDICEIMRTHLGNMSANTKQAQEMTAPIKLLQ